MKVFALFTIITVTVMVTPAFAGGLNPVARGPHIAYDDDAAVIANNPAVLNLYDHYLGFGSRIVKPDFTYKSGNTIKHSDQDKLYLMPFASWVKRLDDDVVLGIGAYVPYGLGAKFNNNPQQLGYDTETELSLMNLAAGAGIQLTDKLSIGFYANGGYARFKYVAPFDVERIPLPIQTANNGDGLGFSATVGGLYKLTDNLNWGILYTTRCDSPLNGHTTLKLGQLSVRDSFSSEFRFPARLGTGISWQPNDKWRLGLDANYFWYAVDKEMSLKFHRIPMTKTNRLDWNNVYSINAELGRRLNESISVAIGADYMTAAITDTVSTLMPDGTGWDVTAKIRKDCGKAAIDGQVIYAWGNQKSRQLWRMEEYRADIWTVKLGVSW